MNHLHALVAVARTHPRVGLGQLNLLPPDIAHAVGEMITLQSAQSKQEIIAEVDKKGHEAKMYALLGGVSAGLAGVGIGVLIGRALR